jgi:hypothetical protein
MDDNATHPNPSTTPMPALQNLAPNQCPFCLEVLHDVSWKISHQQQTGHWEAPAPDHNTTMDNADQEDRSQLSSPVDMHFENSSQHIPTTNPGFCLEHSQVLSNSPIQSNYHPGSPNPVVSDCPKENFDDSLQGKYCIQAQIMYIIFLTLRCRYSPLWDCYNWRWVMC